MDIQYVKGDATSPIGGGYKRIIHVCNDIGGWGRGFVLAISKKWKYPEHYYKSWYLNRVTTEKLSESSQFKLGNVQYVPVATDIEVINMIAQHDIKYINDVPPIRYDALRECLRKVASSHTPNSTVHAPRFGAGLAGGDWKKIERIIREELCSKNIPVIIYDYSDKS